MLLALCAGGLFYAQPFFDRVAPIIAPQIGWRALTHDILLPFGAMLATAALIASARFYRPARVLKSRGEGIVLENGSGLFYISADIASIGPDVLTRVLDYYPVHSVLGEPEETMITFHRDWRNTIALAVILNAKTGRHVAGAQLKEWAVAPAWIDTLLAWGVFLMLLQFGLGAAFASLVIALLAISWARTRLTERYARHMENTLLRFMLEPATRRF
ncbi:MAG TPA: hypothetical protein PLS69_08050 [Terricaulis sp.]|nr:hypothetical protein [Terricaulis sp.]HRP11209.1 hypothetical protein [Terricaulis sp.]